MARQQVASIDSQRVVPFSPALLTGCLVVVFLATGVLEQRRPAVAQERTVDLTPTVWNEGELEHFLQLNGQLGNQNELASSEHGVIAGTTGAPAIRAGLEALRQGGSAADAALTTSLTQIALANGCWVSYAGILTMVYYDAAEDRVYNLNAAYNTVLGEDEPDTIPIAPAVSDEPGRAVLVPGYMAGVAAAHGRFGKLPFDSIFGPAIYFAEEGVELSPFHAGRIEARREILERTEAGRRIFFHEDGEPYRTGERFRQPEVAATLRAVAEQGADYMYEGPWARDFVETVRAAGGRMAREDLRQYEVIWSDPLVIPHLGYEIHTHGLPAHGGVHLAEALQVAKAAGIENLGDYEQSPESFFWVSQLGQLFTLSYIEPRGRAMLLGTENTGLEHRLTEEHAEYCWRLIQTNGFVFARMPEGPQNGHSDAIVAIDQWGNMAAMVHTINTSSWGDTGLFVGGVSVPDSAKTQKNQIEEAGPGMRLRDDTAPLLLFHDDQPVAALASIGAGLHIKTFCTLLQMIEQQRSLPEAVNAPSLHLFVYEFQQAPQPQIFAGDFDDGLLERLPALGLEPKVLTPGPENWGPRGFTVGAGMDHVTGVRQAVATDTLNAPALGQ